jgi:hypothetical protein
MHLNFYGRSFYLHWNRQRYLKHWNMNYLILKVCFPVIARDVISLAAKTEAVFSK